jgi:phasin protein
MTASSSSLAKCWQTIAAEASEYSKKSFENGSAFFEKLLGAKGELYSNFAKEAFKPIETAVTKVQAAKE